ncbi:hypothetical protein [Aneurinibacillus aneurinilyticus]|jgi:hypothetical protein|uniref:hypothetical protein n=1 Tax=Aneurinibacillus aneurinilyticus TaxID=1391 RepID=UPI0023F8575D|nr:hypothetical protein [Aneurinibacillus aneurinilyticus]MCI1696954.1 hypothetical protein [Aneurinibacillus aneurinilyticus]
MIPLRYREVLPPYWYEIDMAERHFSVMEEAMNGREKITNELRDQFILQRATYALEVWEWIYFRKVQTGSFEERREAIRKKRWAKQPFKLPVLRLMGSQSGKLLDVTEDFLKKEVLFEYAADEAINLVHLYRDFEYIRPVHVNRAVAVAKTMTTPIIVQGDARNFDVTYRRCGETITEGIRDGQLAQASVHVLGDIYGFDVPYRRCGEAYTGEEA